MFGVGYGQSLHLTENFGMAGKYGNKRGYLWT